MGISDPGPTRCMRQLPWREWPVAKGDSRVDSPPVVTTASFALGVALLTRFGTKGFGLRQSAVGSNNGIAGEAVGPGSCSSYPDPLTSALAVRLRIVCNSVLVEGRHMRVEAQPMTSGDRPAASGTHAHLWALPDGTSLHCPPGELVQDAQDGRLCCHLCGRWFVSLGAHVRVHGYTAADYRTAMGLCSGLGLVAAALSASIADRQQRAYRETPLARDRFAVGQDLARSGWLSWWARAAAQGPAEPAQRVRARSTSLAAGRASQRAARELRLQRRLAELGADDLEGYLRSAYAAGTSLEALAAATGLGRASLRSALARAGVTVRPPGVNTADGRRSRALAADQEAAQRLGVADLQAWLADRHREGWSLHQLAAVVGHSSHWVRWRLPAGDAQTPPAGAA